MKAKPVVPRALADRDIDEAIDWYLADGGERAARGFIDALEHAFLHIGRYPAIGSPRYAHELNLPACDHGRCGDSPISCSTSRVMTTSMSGVCCTADATCRRGCRRRKNAEHGCLLRVGPLRCGRASGTRPGEYQYRPEITDQMLARAEVNTGGRPPSPHPRRRRTFL